MKPLSPALALLALLGVQAPVTATGVNNQCCRSAREASFPPIDQRSLAACTGTIWTSARRGVCLGNQPGSIGKNCINSTNFKTIVEVREYRLNYDNSCEATPTGRTSPVQIETCSGDPCSE